MIVVGLITNILIGAKFLANKISKR